MLGTLRPYLPWLATSLVAIGIILSSDSPQIDSLRSNFSDLTVIVTQPFARVLHAPRIWRENKYLREMLAEMSLKLANASQSAAENKRLRRMLELRKRSDFQLIAGEVIGLNPDVGIRGLQINIGAMDGVTKNCAVITPEGVVGRINSVGEHSSSVQLLIDPNIGIAGRIRTIDEDGIIHAAGGRKLKLDGIPITVTVPNNDLIMTSGLDSIFPAGIPVGYIKNITKAQSGWLWEIEIEPIVDFGSLRQIFVIRKVEDDN